MTGDNINRVNALMRQWFIATRNEIPFDLCPNLMKFDAY